jgi:hypothetical protein
MWGWGSLSHAIKLIHRANCEFDLDQMEKAAKQPFGFCEAFSLIGPNQVKT